MIKINKHYKIICMHCKQVMGECRCGDSDKPIEYSICPQCLKNLWS